MVQLSLPQFRRSPSNKPRALASNSLKPPKFKLDDDEDSQSSSDPTPSNTYSHSKSSPTSTTLPSNRRKASGVSGDSNTRTAKLVERLHHIVVFELVKKHSNPSDPSNPVPPPVPVMRNMRLRDLYNYIQDKVCDGDDSIEAGVERENEDNTNSHSHSHSSYSDISSIPDVLQPQPQPSDNEKRKKIMRRRASSFQNTPEKATAGKQLRGGL